MDEQVLNDITALLRFAPEGPAKDEIWGRYGDAIKARVAAKAAAKGWSRKGAWLEKVSTSQ